MYEVTTVIDDQPYPYMESDYCDMYQFFCEMDGDSMDSKESMDDMTMMTMVDTEFFGMVCIQADMGYGDMCYDVMDGFMMSGWEMGKCMYKTECEFDTSIITSRFEGPSRACPGTYISAHCMGEYDSKDSMGEYDSKDSMGDYDKESMDESMYDTCDHCVKKFAMDGGCECWHDEMCDQNNLIPPGCDMCGEPAAEYCDIDFIHDEATLMRMVETDHGMVCVGMHIMLENDICAGMMEMMMYEHQFMMGECEGFQSECMFENAHGVLDHFPTPVCETAEFMIGCEDDTSDSSEEMPPTEAPVCEDNPEWRNNRGRDCAWVRRQGRECTSDAMFANCCATCAALAPTTTMPQPTEPVCCEAMTLECVACAAGMSEREYCRMYPRDEYRLCWTPECEDGEWDMEDVCAPRQCVDGMYGERLTTICPEIACMDGSMPPVAPGACCGDVSMCPKMKTCPETADAAMSGPCDAYVDELTCDYGEICCCDKCFSMQTSTCMEGSWMTFMTDACMNPACETTMPATEQPTYLVPDLGLIDSMRRVLERNYSNARLQSAGQRAAALLQEKDENNNKVAPLYDPDVKSALQKVKRFWKNADMEADNSADYTKQRNQYNRIAEILDLETIEM